MKPLELTIYERDESFPGASNLVYRYGAKVLGDITVHSKAHRKRFTDAELAAEYWAPNWITLPDADWDEDYEASSAEMLRRSATLHRFATLPHALDTP